MFCSLALLAGLLAEPDLWAQDKKDNGWICVEGPDRQWRCGKGEAPDPESSASTSSAGTSGRESFPPPDQSEAQVQTAPAPPPFLQARPTPSQGSLLIQAPGASSAPAPASISREAAPEPSPEPDAAPSADESTATTASDQVVSTPPSTQAPVAPKPQVPAPATVRTLPPPGTGSAEFALQLGSSPGRHDLNAASARFDLPAQDLYQLPIEGVWKLLYGRYASRDEALVAWNGLPSTLRDAGVWVRPVPQRSSQVSAAGSSPITGAGDDLPKGLYTLQLLASPSRETADGLIARHDLDQARVLATERDGQTWWIVAYGSYPNLASARAAINSLPAPLQAAEPWVRPTASLRP